MSEKTLTGTLTEALVTISSRAANEALNTNSSVATMSSELSVTPICYIDARLAHLADTFHIVSGALTFFSSCYVSSIAIMTNTRISNAMETIDRLNPKRELSWYRSVKETDNGGISIKAGLGKSSNESHDFAINLFEKDKLSSIVDNYSAEDASISVSGSDDKKIEESQSLSIGKRIYLDVMGGGSDSTESEDNASKSSSRLPLTVRFNTYILSGGLMTDFVSLLGIDRRFTSRVRALTSGRINFGELMTMSDIVNSKKRLLLKDRDGRIKEIYSRRLGNAAVSMATGNASLGTIANTVIISDKTRKEAEFKLGYRFKDFGHRENFMKESSTMILIVVDEETEMTVMYVHGNTSYSEIPISDYKKASKKDGNNITDIIKAFNVGNTVTF